MYEDLMEEVVSDVNVEPDWDRRRKALLCLGLNPDLVRSANTGRGARRMARHPALQQALRNATLNRLWFLLPSDLAAKPA